MRAWWTALLMVAACGFPRPADVPDHGPGDANAPPADAQLCFGAFVRVCFDSEAALPTEARHWGDDGNNVTIDTDVASVCDQHNDQKATYCVVTGAGMTFAQTKTFRATGTKPLVLLSTAPVDVMGFIDLSTSGGLLGAGADPVDQCTGATPVMGNSGGAGGSFGGRGGDGGRVNADAGSSSAAPRLAYFPASLRGGCAGENGEPGAAGGAGGRGGGAVAIIAPSMSLAGAINASGEFGNGGFGGPGGGGGGGSGGMIVLDVPMTGILRGPSGVLFANGGGGGEGADASQAGRPGRNPSAPTPAAPGGGTGSPGNMGNPDGGNGGDGSAGAETNGSTSPGGAQPSDGAGGGGGGAAGFIHAPGLTGDAVISPPSLDLPQSPT